MDKKICITGEISGRVTFNMYTKSPEKEETVVVSPESKRRKITFGTERQTGLSQASKGTAADPRPAFLAPNTNREDDDQDGNLLNGLYEQHKNNPDDYFQMTIRPKGIVLVINNHSFTSTKIKPRRGSKNDCKSLFDAFSDIGGCEITFREDLPAVVMMQELESLANSKKKAAFYAIFIMSHGTSKRGKDIVVGADGGRVSCKEIADLFNVPHLKDTPKLLFFQACRGPEVGAAAYEPPQQFGEQRDGEPIAGIDSDDENDYSDLEEEVLNSLIDVLPNSKIIGGGPADEADAAPAVLVEDNNASVEDCFSRQKGNDEQDEAVHEYVDEGNFPNVMVSLSAAEGHTSLRRVESGSWFIQEICKQFRSQAAKEDDLISMMTRIHARLYDKRSQNYGKYKAAARTGYTFRKKLYFFPGL